MSTLLVRAYRPAGDPDALGDLALDELAALRLWGFGKPPTEPQLSEMICRMQDQVDIGRLVLKKRTTRLPAEPLPLHYAWQIGMNDHYRVDPFSQGEARTTVRECPMGPESVRDAVAINFPADRVDWVVTRQAAGDLYDFDPENWSDAASTWRNAENQLPLHEPRDSGPANTTKPPISTADTQLPLKVFRAKVEGRFDTKRLDSIIKNRGGKNRPQPYAAAFNDDKTVNLIKFKELATSRGEWKADWEYEEGGSPLHEAVRRMSLVK